MDYLGRRATIMGLGHFGGGIEAARWLARRGARVTVTDLATESSLATSLDALAGDPVWCASAMALTEALPAIDRLTDE